MTSSLELRLRREIKKLKAVIERDKNTHRKYRRSKRGKAVTAARSKRAIVNLTPGYLKTVLRSRGLKPPKTFPLELVELMRAQIKLHRTIRNLTNDSNGQNESNR